MYEWSVSDDIRQLKMSIRFLLVLLFAVVVLKGQSITPPNIEADSFSKLLPTVWLGMKPGVFNNLAKLQARNNHNLARIYAETALELSKQSNDKHNQALALCMLGDIETIVNHYKEAQILYLQALELAYSTKDKELLATIMDCKAYLCEIEGSYNESIRLIRESQSLRSTTKNKIGIAQSFLNLGNIYQLKSKYDSAFICFDQAFILYEGMNNLNGKARVYNNLGNIHFYLANYDTAVYYFQKSLKIKEITKDRPGVARTLNNIAAVYYQGGQLPQALDYYRRSQSINTLFSKENCYGNIGLVYSDMKKYDSALYYHSLAQSLYEKTGNQKGIASSLTNKGLLYINRTEYPKALEHLNKALSINILLDEGSEIALTKQYIGYVYLLQGRLNDALNITLECGKLCSRLGLRKQKMEVSKQLSDIYHQLGNPAKAFYHISQYNNLRDSIFDEEQQVKIARMMEKYEIEKREQQIYLLTAEKINSGLKLQKNNIMVLSLSAIFLLIALVSWLLFNRFRMKRNQLQLALEWKAADIEHRLVQSQLNPHVISNSVQTIRTFLTKDNVEKAHHYLDKFSHFLKIVLVSSRQSFITLAKELELIRAYLELEQIHRSIKIDFSIFVDPSLDCDAIELPSIFIQPFVENAIKHGLKPLKKEGIVLIKFLKVNDYLLCIIEDNGVGRKKADELKQDKLALFPSLGNQLIKDRVKLLLKLEHLAISIETTDLYDLFGQAAGTHVEIRIPVDN
jgi:tetratricopeptide (TPR) repeat protein